MSKPIIDKMNKAIDLAKDITAKVSPSTENIPMPRPPKPIPLIHDEIPNLATGGKAVRRAMMVASEAPRVVKRAGGSTTLPMDAESRNKRATDMGFSGPWYHGAGRLDRVLENDKMDPARATSGPMPFFTNNPAVASDYANGKLDTSLYEENLKKKPRELFTVHPKHLGLKGDGPITVEDSWDFLPYEIKQQIAQKARNVGVSNLQQGESPLTLNSNFTGLRNGADYANAIRDYKNYNDQVEAAGGNHLKALRKSWGDHSYNESDDEANNLAHIYSLVGYPLPINDTRHDAAFYPGVLPAMLQMKNPLHTTDTKYIKNVVIPHLENVFKNDKTEMGYDWNKNSFSPKYWIGSLKADLKRGSNSFAWTSIPDKITEQLAALGHDGIIDTGDKQNRGIHHNVAIPFYPHQVRSRFAQFDPEQDGQVGLGKAHGGEVSHEPRMPKNYNKEALYAGNRGLTQAKALPIDQQLPEVRDQTALEDAQKLTDAGMNPADVRKQTGWFGGHKNDARGRFEIDDSGAKFHLPFDQWQMGQDYNLEDVLHHPALFQLYPHMRHIKIRRDNLGALHGYANPSTGEIRLNANTQPLSGAVVRTGHKIPPPADPMDTVLHEVQHMIQEHEGFTGGSNPAAASGLATPKNIALTQRAQMVKANDLAAYRQSVYDSAANLSDTPEFKKYIRMKENLDRANPPIAALFSAKAKQKHEEDIDRKHQELDDAFKDHIVSKYGAHPQVAEDIIDHARPVWQHGWTMRQSIGDHQNTLMNETQAYGPEFPTDPDNEKFHYELYKRHLGEIEARDVAARRHYTPEQRKAIAPYSSERFDPDEIITRAAGGEVSGRTLTPQGLYSHGAEAAEALNQAKGSGQQMVASLKGVKPEELKWSGVADMASQPKVTKEELAEKFKQSMPDIRETQLGGLGGMGDPKFRDYTVPQGSNYREILLHLPPTVRVMEQHKAVRPNGLTAGVYDNLAIAQMKAKEIGGHVVSDTPITLHGGYRSNHWETPNVLAHLRLSDRKTPEGQKALHLEELQSDWGQAARGNGTINAEDRQRVGDTQAALMAATAARDDARNNVDSSRPETIAASRAAEAAFYNAQHHALMARERVKKGVDAAPYIGNTQGWTDLGLKRALYEAAKGGHDKLVWTNGELQNQRYDLSKHIKHIDYQTNEDGTHTFVAYDHNGNEAIDHGGATHKQVAEMLGKEIADKMENGHGDEKRYSDFKRLSGLDLQVGGEGMKGYYDNVLPKSLLALAKQHDPDAQLGSDEIVAGTHKSGFPAHVTLPSLTITPKMRESILKNGFKAYKRGGDVGKTPNVSRAVSIASQAMKKVHRA
jgi:hypothetical protein